MNKLSWLIYVADIGERLTPAAWTLFGFIVIGLVLWFIALNAQVESAKEVQRIPVWPAIVSLAVAVAMTFLPSMKAAYLIGASELGQQFVQSPEAARVLEKILK